MRKIEYIGPERRKYLRFPRRCVVKYAKLSKSNLRPLVNLTIKSYTKEISGAGIKFIARKKMSIHTIIEFQFNIPEINRPINGLGEVVRVKVRPGGRSYNVAMKFIWMQKKNIDLIDGYIRKKRIQQVMKKL
ncbi:MAG: PilZ domain-containing protein [Candidatus Omnitrophota bacterium]|nr:MAG: PilZ domain-containing protein [Candidatus Omnitrophota bacterium]